jgi:ribosome maturation factor RimP
MENTELLKEKMESLVNGIIADSPDHFLVEVKLLPKKKIQVFVDAETGIKIEKCVQISRALEKVLDEEKWFGDDYNLEVSSPGMDSPLKVLRQFKRRIGREVEVLLNSGVKHEGVLKEANELSLTLEKTIKLNKKESVTETHEFLFSDIKHTKLILNF